MRHYCTLFNRAYAEKGLALYQSLKRYSSEPFTLHVLAMDQRTFEVLSEMNLSGMQIYPHEAFETDMRLKGIKATRTVQEYCWTCASQFMAYILPFLPEVTYLDADLFFYSDPAPVHAEIGERSIAITPHRFPAHKKYMERNGKFNVGWVTAKNDAVGGQCILTWMYQCKKKCSATDGCGDQRYLDSWPNDYGQAVCVLDNPGVNLGPWTLAGVDITSGPKVNGVDLICYHFHEFKDETQLTNYFLRTCDLAFIYAPYIAAWKSARGVIADIEARLDHRKTQMELQAERA